MQDSARANPKYLTPFSSIFLDSLRLLAALDVAFTHARAIWFRDREYDFIPSRLAHGSVVIFFVLSGYIIAYTTSIKKRTAKEYSAARLGRLYSGILPALLFTILVSVVLQNTNPQILNEYSRENNTWRYIVSLFFCNEIWFFSAAPLLNGVIWSLSYEFWFYVIFGCWMYKKDKKGFFLLSVIIFIAGPKILLMMPIWILGVLAYKLPKPQLTSLTRFLLIIFLLMVSIAVMLFLLQLPYEVNTSNLYWASSFVSDFIAAIFIAIAFWLLPLSNISITIENRRIKNFRRIADLTFPIYVFHYPCLVLCKFLLSSFNTSYITMSIALAMVLIFCFIVGIYIEKWHQMATGFFKKLFNKVPAKSLCL